jgi:hypothetical protein
MKGGRHGWTRTANRKTRTGGPESTRQCRKRFCSSARRSNRPCLKAFPWPERTRQWWAAWGGAPQSVLFSDTDWEFLYDTALLHATAWSSAERAVENGGRIDTSQHAELRLRVAKFGATVEDRARLRITFAIV